MSRAVYAPPPQAVGDRGSYDTLQTEDPQTMPPDIAAAYDRGESMSFSKERGCWELYKALEPAVSLSDGALALLQSYHLGELPPHIHNRLTELFTDPPHDITERLEIAALFVKEQAQ